MNRVLSLLPDRVNIVPGYFTSVWVNIVLSLLPDCANIVPGQLILD